MKSNFILSKKIFLFCLLIVGCATIANAQFVEKPGYGYGNAPSISVESTVQISGVSSNVVIYVAWSYLDANGNSRGSMTYGYVRNGVFEEAGKGTLSLPATTYEVEVHDRDRNWSRTFVRNTSSPVSGNSELLPKEE